MPLMPLLSLSICSITNHVMTLMYCDMCVRGKGAYGYVFATKRIA